MTPRDHTETALARLHRWFDGDENNNALWRAEEHLRDAGLADMADVIAEYRARIGGDDADVRAIYDRLWAMLDEWPVTAKEAA